MWVWLWLMPSQSITLDTGQYQYIVATKDSEQSVSARVRELVDAGIDAEDGDADDE